MTDNDTSVHSLHGANLFSVYEAIFNSISDAVVFTDTQRRVIHMNQAATRLFGYRPQEVRGKTTDFLYANPADFHEQGKVRYSPHRPANQNAYELEYKRKDGSHFIGETHGNHVNDMDGKLLGFIGVIRDITEKKQADELALRFGRIVEDSLNETFLFRENDLRFVEVNRGARENLGYSMDELRQMTPVDIKPEFTREQFIELVQPLRSGTRDKLRFETIHQRKNGTTYPVEIHLQLVNFGSENVFLAIVLDITERRQAEELQRQLTTIFDATPDFIGIADTEGKVLYVNAAARRMVGINPEEDATKLRIRDFHTEESTTHIMKVALPTAVRQELWRGNLSFKARDGHTIPTSQVILAHKSREGKVEFFSTVARDITDLKKAEAELKQHRDHLEDLVTERTAMLKEQAQIIDQIHDAVVSTDLGGFITSWNKGAERNFGYSAQEMLGRHISTVYPEEEHEFLQHEVIEPLKQKGEHEIEVRPQKKSGEKFFAHLSLSMLYDDQGKAKGMVGYAIDITKRKQAEILLKTRTEELAAANKELEGFSYSVSHDLRAPLRAIDGFSLALAEDYKDLLDETGKDYLNRVRSGAQRMGELIDDLLQLARVNRSNLVRETVALTDIAEEVIQTLREQTPERTVEVKIAPNLKASADQGLSRIMIDNLLNNAWKYSSLQEHAVIEFGKTRQKGETIFYVKDNGIGFDMKYATRLFGPFQRLHRKDEFTGTGIGLATVQRIVTRHGGRIWAESKVGEGATFYFTLGHN